MKPPKTPLEFDYDLWTTEDSKCMVRIKRTGEECEVNRDIIRLLRAEEKGMRRSRDDELSLDLMLSKGMDGPAWLAEQEEYSDGVIAYTLEEELIESLTPNQRSVYFFCIRGGISYKDYAKARGVSYQSLQQSVEYIRKKARKIF